MNKLDDISKSFKESIDEYNEGVSKSFSLSAIASNKGFKKAVNSLLLITALSSSFSVNATDIVKFENDTQIQQIENVNGDKLDINHLIKIYDIDPQESSKPKEVVSQIPEASFEDAQSGLFKNPFNDSFVTFFVHQDTDAKNEVINDYENFNIDSQNIGHVYDSIVKLGAESINAHIPVFSMEQIDDDKLDFESNPIDPSLVILNKNVDLIQNLEHIKNVDKYNDYLAAVHETHHAATTKLINDYENSENVPVDYSFQYNLGKNEQNSFDIKQENILDKIEDSSEHSADFASVIKLADYMFENGENLDNVNDLLDQVIETRNKSIDGKHYTTPILSIAKEIINKNPNFVNSINDKDLFEISLNLAVTVTEHDYSNDYLYKVSKNENTESMIKESQLSVYSLMDVENPIENLEVGNMNKLFNGSLELHGEPANIQKLCSQLDLESGESLFPSLNDKVKEEFPELGIQNTAEDNKLLNELSQESSPNIKTTIKDTSPITKFKY